MAELRKGDTYILIICCSCFGWSLLCLEVAVVERWSSNEVVACLTARLVSLRVELAASCEA